VTQDIGAAALIATIDREAETEKERILGEARATAGQIEAESEARTAAATAEATRIMEKAARMDEERLLGQVRLETEAEEVRGMRGLHQRVFDLASRRIAELARSPGYPHAVRALVRQALQELKAPGSALTSRGDAAVCREALKEAGLSCDVVDTEPSPGTVILRSAGGVVTVDNSLSVRLAMARQTMESRIARCLNG